MVHLRHLRRVTPGEHAECREVLGALVVPGHRLCVRHVPQRPRVHAQRALLDVLLDYALGLVEAALAPLVAERAYVRLSCQLSVDARALGLCPAGQLSAGSALRLDLG